MCQQQKPCYFSNILWTNKYYDKQKRNDTRISEKIQSKTHEKCPYFLMREREHGVLFGLISHKPKSPHKAIKHSKTRTTGECCTVLYIIPNCTDPLAIVKECTYLKFIFLQSTSWQFKKIKSIGIHAFEKSPINEFHVKIQFVLTMMCLVFICRHHGIWHASFSLRIWMFIMVLNTKWNIRHLQITALS